MDRVILYGTGREFKIMFSLDNDLYEWLRKNDVSIVGIASKSSDKLGQHVNISDSIYEIKHISNFAEDLYDYILVTTTKYFEEIREFLVSLGISEDRVITVESFIDKIINKTSKCKYGISIAAIVKDEAEYIEEWIQFHILMGIEHFYIYDNESSDGTTEILKEYEKTGLVTYIFWPGLAQQVPAYSNAIDCFKNDSIYIAFIDIDEFLFSVGGNKIFDEVNHILHQYERIRLPGEKKSAAIGVNWRTYGTSFYSEKSDDLVIRRFLLRAGAISNHHNIHIKSIYNPRAVLKIFVHHATFVPGYCCISENGAEIWSGVFREGRCQRLRINHYVFKSDEEYIKRKKGTDAWAGDLNRSEEFIKRVLSSCLREYNEHYDPILVKYSDLVENAIKEWRDKHNELSGSF